MIAKNGGDGDGDGSPLPLPSQLEINTAQLNIYLADEIALDIDVDELKVGIHCFLI